MKTTKFTRTGVPRIGSMLDIDVTGNGDWERVTIVGHLNGQRGALHGVVGVIVEWDDGSREQGPWPLTRSGIDAWRAVV